MKQAGFRSLPVLIDKGGVFTLGASLRFYSADLRGMVIAPKGMETDLASIPLGLWNVFPKIGKYDAAAVIHDAGYRGLLVTNDGTRINLIKPLVDKLFLEAMLSLGVGPIRAKLMYLAVKAFGRGSFNANGVIERA